LKADYVTFLSLLGFRRSGGDLATLRRINWWSRLVRCEVSTTAVARGFYLANHVKA